MVEHLLNPGAPAKKNHAICHAWISKAIKTGYSTQISCQPALNINDASIFQKPAVTFFELLHGLIIAGRHKSAEDRGGPFGGAYTLVCLPARSCIWPVSLAVILQLTAQELNSLMCGAASMTSVVARSENFSKFFRNAVARSPSF